MSAKKIIFVTGTDTGVGKTLLTALLLQHLRQTGVHALAMKPFCSGGLADVSLLQSLQSGELSNAEMNPFYFDQPIAPYVAASRKHPIRLNAVIERITHVQKKCDLLLIEGSGGLMVPLGKGFTVAELITKLDCRVVVTARNRLGTINHTLLTVNALRWNAVPKINTVVMLMSCPKADLSAQTNLDVIATWIKPISVLSIPFLGHRANSAESVHKHCIALEKTLSRVIDVIE